MSQTHLLNGVAVTLLVFIGSAFCQGTSYQMLTENCNWPSTNYVSTTWGSIFPLTSPSMNNQDLVSNLVCKTRVYINSSYYKLKLRVRKFDLKGSSDCSASSERVILQISGYSNITWCGKTYPEEMILSVQSINIIYNTGRVGEGKGFQIDFSAVPNDSCYELGYLDVTTQPKLLYSPNYPGNYKSSFTCSVSLIPQVGQYIHIQSLSMDIEEAPNCSYDALIINNVRYCGQTPIDVIINSNYTTILLKTDGYKENSGFVLKYVALPVETLQCWPYAQNFTVNATTSRSIVILEKSVYSNIETECQVTFDSGSSSRTLDVILPQNLQDIKNYKLTVYGETPERGALYITNSSGPRPYQTQGQTTLNYLHSPGKQVVFSGTLLGNSFTFQVQAVDRDSLPGRVTARHSLIWVSTALASTYSTPPIFITPEKMEEENVEVGVFYSYQFNDSLNQETSRQTVANYAYVYNGKDNSYFELTQGCIDYSRSPDKAIYSINSKSITVVPRNYIYTGFWLYIGPSDSYVLPKPLELSTYSSYRSSIYLNTKNLYCSWTLSESMQEEMVIEPWIIRFTADNSFNKDITGNSFIVADESKVLMKYTQLTKKGIFLYSTTPINITVSTFRAEDNGKPINFGFTFEILKSWINIQSVNCQPVQLQATTSIQYAGTPNYPNLYNNNNCEWTIDNSLSSGYVDNIVIEFPDLSNISCGDNEVDVLTRYSSGGDFFLMYTLCSRNSYNVSFYQDAVKIKLVSKSQYMQPGFHFAYYTEGVKKDFNLYANSIDDYFSSPNYPDNYPNGVDYTWYITTSSYQDVIMVELVYFSLEDDLQLQCSNDYVKVYDGGSTYSRLLKVFCGRIFYAKFNSTGSDMTIVFHSDRQNNAGGFKFKYHSQKKATDSDCCSSNFMGVIIGIITGGVICILLIMGAIICLVRRRKRLRDGTSNRVPARAAGIGVPVARGNNSMFIMSPASMNLSLAPPSYMTVQNSHLSTDPPPYATITGNTNYILPGYTPRFNDFQNPGYTVHDLPPPYTPDMPGGTAQQVPGVVLNISRQGSTTDGAVDGALLPIISVDPSMGNNFGNVNEVVGNHLTNENIYEEIRDNVMNAATAPSEMEHSALTQHQNHVGYAIPLEAPPAYDNQSFVHDNGQQQDLSRILPQKKDDRLGSL